MGLCFTKMTEEEKEQLKRSKLVAKQLDNDERTDSALVKLLLLGAGESGKSTIFKQMRILYGDGFDESSRSSLAPVILTNLITGTILIIENSRKMLPAEDHALVGDAAEAASTIEDYAKVNVQGGQGSGGVLPEPVAAAVKTLWTDAQFQKTHDRRAEFQLFSSYEDFAKACTKKYPAWGGEGWLPSVSDVTKARVRTSGIVEEQFLIDGVEFRMYDVGGQRNERKKWIHCFDNVTALIFVGAISEYDQVLYEDKTQNRLIEAFDLFEEICNSKWFSETSIILFMNKRDLFEEKYLEKKVPLNVTGLFGPADAEKGIETDFKVGLAGMPGAGFAPAYDYKTLEDGTSVYGSGPDEGKEIDFSYDESTEWLVKVFMCRKQNPDKEVYHHITCATDKENISTVFNACKDIILKGNLKGSGFLE